MVEPHLSELTQKMNVGGTSTIIFVIRMDATSFTKMFSSVSADKRDFY